MPQKLLDCYARALRTESLEKVIQDLNARFLNSDSIGIFMFHELENGTPGALEVVVKQTLIGLEPEPGDAKTPNVAKVGVLHFVSHVEEKLPRVIEGCTLIPLFSVLLDSCLAQVANLARYRALDDLLVHGDWLVENLVANGLLRRLKVKSRPFLVALVVKKQVVIFDVAMNDLLGREVFDCLKRLESKVAHNVVWRRALGCHLRAEVREVLEVAVGHDHNDEVVFLQYVNQWHDEGEAVFLNPCHDLLFFICFGPSNVVEISLVLIRTLLVLHYLCGIQCLALFYFYDRPEGTIAKRLVSVFVQLLCKQLFGLGDFANELARS